MRHQVLGSAVYPADKLDRHNESLHDGTECAAVDSDVANHLADLVATDLDLLE